MGFKALSFSEVAFCPSRSYSGLAYKRVAALPSTPSECVRSCSEFDGLL